MEQDFDLRGRGAILCQLLAQLGLAGLGRRGRFPLKTGDVF